MNMQTLNGFQINFIFLANVPPFDAKSPAIIQTRILRQISKTTDYLLKIFDSAINDCKVEINFKSDGKQNNEFRKALMQIMETTTIASKAKRSLKIVEKL